MAKQKRPATAKRKRAKGGGRKPKGEVSGLGRHFSIRMPNWLHAQLQDARKTSGRSIGQELMWRARNTFAQDLADTDPPAMQSLCFLIARIGRDASSGPTEDSWRTDPHSSKVFQRAVAVLLHWLEPAGNPRPGDRPYASPEDEGDDIAEKLWYELRDPPKPQPVPDEEFEHALGPRGSDPQLRKIVRKIIADRDYGMVNANRDLLGSPLANEPSVEQAPGTREPALNSAQPEPPAGGLLGILPQPLSQ